ncbi:hypothetical protein [Arthrobacter sp. Rue61a]|uniref:hypothetical protein n=1 Tax=Arthrobacter sp. Rue61a TaxID=1118963 RepID=UPI00027DF2C7|nr:hypothetical protein [Arthrobacter sp. Rue61a]AFR31213.1 hypothetical protein ARUE_232p00050 [Arthrobacter sp. Rue61a]
MMKKAVAGLATVAMLVGGSACSAPTKEVAPQVCIDAIDHSNEIVDLVTDVIELNTSVIDKRTSFDAASKKMKELQPKIRAASDAWVAASDQCKAKR